ncbi:50S ribosomal protein L18 [Microgenomates group bacterium]|nr:50S ribosomal protein L18 [Microgenomates group bacterium]
MSNQRALRTRKHLTVSADRPRLTIHRSNQHFYLQLVDVHGKTITAVSSVSKEKSNTKLTKTQVAQEVAKTMAAILKKQKVSALVIDRGSYRYHGRVKAAVEIIRQSGIEV